MDHMKSIKYNYRVLNDVIYTLADFHRELKKMTIIDKKKFSQIRRIQKDSHKKKRFLQMITNKKKYVQVNYL